MRKVEWYSTVYKSKNYEKKTHVCMLYVRRTYIDVPPPIVCVHQVPFLKTK